ncbi:class IV adenylate cyclase [Fodinicola feengrottensis]|uniref:CYTH domain-containing protein n=1 Tax=Fodinicola feengrottensis TaxID=435914 RepID=A0ABN2G5U8_9ACTN|nr:CYTH domain-containing protein [Fodinicola feengrottensis]
MATEFEAKVLDIDPDEMTARILVAGGTLTRAITTMRRYVYDIDPTDATRWIRLRDNGNQTTLTVKEIRNDNIDGTDETEIVVNDFATTNLLLEKLGFNAKSYQENRRTSFAFGHAQLEIDQWPLIPPYLEIESTSPEEVIATARKLAIGEEQLTGENTVKVYARHHINLADIKELRFPN